MSTECDSGLEQEDMNQYKKGGYHPVEIGDIFLDRYLVKRKIGWGQFSTVWLCQDTELNTYVALKIQKSALYYSDAAAAEISMLEVVKEHSNSPLWLGSNASKKNFIVNLLNSFSHRGPNGRHVCMVFEILGISLLEVIKIYDFKGLPVSLCKSFITKILTGLDFLHRVIGIIHTDLKPENILIELNKTQINELLNHGEIKTQLKRKIPKIEEIPKTLNLVASMPSLMQDDKTKKILKKKRYTKRKKEQKKTLPAISPVKKKKKKNKNNENCFNSKLNIKIVDFGNAVHCSGLCNNEIQTRQYRSPEVILGNNYTTAADIWSVGCILFELLTGELLYQPHAGEDFTEDDDHLAQIWENIGEFPMEWANKTKKAWKYFSKNSLKRVPELHIFMIQDILREKYHFSPDNSLQISMFLKLMLEIEPEKRITAEDCLKHPWLAAKNK